MSDPTRSTGCLGCNREHVGPAAEHLLAMVACEDADPSSIAEAAETAAAEARVAAEWREDVEEGTPDRVIVVKDEGLDDEGAREIREELERCAREFREADDD